MLDSKKRAVMVQRIDKALGMINKKIGKMDEEDLLGTYADEMDYVLKARPANGFEGFESGDLPEEGKKILAKVYAKARRDGGDKDKCSKIAWGAIKNSGVKKTLVLKALYSRLNDLSKALKSKGYEFKKFAGGKPTMIYRGIPVITTEDPQAVPQGTDKVQKRIIYRGLPLALEWLNGQSRTFEGSEYVNPMVGTHYGYIENTIDGDGSPVDVYFAEPASEQAPVFKMDQLKAEDQTFDEHKFFLGFDTMENAQKAYTQAMPEKMMGGMVEMSLEEFIDKYLKFHNAGVTDKDEVNKSDPPIPGEIVPVSPPLTEPVKEPETALDLANAKGLIKDNAGS